MKQPAKSRIKGGGGTEKDTDSNEVGGRRRNLLYTCWNDGVGNYVYGNWRWFTCWRCGALNYM
jgi:hypothetical protein